jgi:hypothetical protein
MSRASDARVAHDALALPTRRVSDVEPKPPGQRWLVDQLWTSSAVGVVGGQPKAFKTWLAAELALAVAGGGKALGRFEAHVQGPVLFFAAEDEPSAMRARFEAVAAARGAVLAKLPIFLLDVWELRLDDASHIQRLHRTVDALRPRLLILDPFVRCVRLDENSAQEVSAVLGALRTLQRQHDVAVIVVHHMRKSPSSHPGQQLRGSGDFLAWADSALYLTRRGEQRLLTAEHRGAPSLDPLRVRLAEPGPHLELDDAPPLTSSAEAASPGDSSLHLAVLQCLRASRLPQSASSMRVSLKVRKSSLLEALRLLEARKLVQRHEDGWAPAGSPR